MESKIPKHIFKRLLIVGIIVDVLQFLVNLLHLIPIGITNIIATAVSTVLSIFGWGGVMLYLKMRGVNLGSGKNLQQILLSAGIEALPFISSLPGLTLAIVRISSFVWIEEKAAAAAANLNRPFQAQQNNTVTTGVQAPPVWRPLNPTTTAPASTPPSTAAPRLTDIRPRT